MLEFLNGDLMKNFISLLLFLLLNQSFAQDDLYDGNNSPENISQVNEGEGTTDQEIIRQEQILQKEESAYNTETPQDVLEDAHYSERSPEVSPTNEN